MAGWTRPGSIPAPGPTAAVWSPAGLAAGLPGFPADAVANIFARVCEVARQKLPGVTVWDWSHPAADPPDATETTPLVRLTPSIGGCDPVCQSGDEDGTVYRLVLRIEAETTILAGDPSSSMGLWRAVLGVFRPIDAELDALGVCAATIVAPSWGFPAPGDNRTRTAGRVDLITYFTAPN